MRVLFILKKNHIYSHRVFTRRSSGLWNSTRFIVEGLSAFGLDAHIVEVTDNNCIDREVSSFNPDVVVIEALWVVPEKFDILKKLHPGVKWFVHLHSHIPFLALEGISIGWLIKYAERGVGIIANSKAAYDALSSTFFDDELIFLPNVYIPKIFSSKKKIRQDKIVIACIGAIRPMKNHLLQALAAIQFARELGRPLEFWVNSGRVEAGGEPVLKCLRNLFEAASDASLVEANWGEPEEYIKSMHDAVDMGMQVSMTETFNVVSADYVSAGLPIVVSEDVYWASDFCKAEYSSLKEIVRVMHRVYRWRWLIRWNQFLLKRHEKKAVRLWYDWLLSL